MPQLRPHCFRISGADVAKRFVTYCWSTGFVSARSPVVRGTICNVPPPITIAPATIVDTTALSLLRVAITVRLTGVYGIAASVAVTANAAAAPNEDGDGPETAMFDDDVTAKSTASPAAAFGSIAAIFTVPEQSRQSARLAVSELIVNADSVRVSVTAAVWASAPLAPLKVIAALPAVADAEAEKVTAWLAPALTENGAVGEEETFCGSP